ncbi:MAG: flagellar hook-basal body complex protein FliE [Planctomycetota bacterium]|jgi:flagellar hook-basal body complex protein FliE
MINLNANVTSVPPHANKLLNEAGNGTHKSDFANTVKALGKYISQVDDLQQSSDVSIKDLLSGKSVDITTVVSEVAKADMSFKLLVGVRNKLIEAYKQTMSMPL